MNSMLKTTTNVNHSYNQWRVDSCSSRSYSLPTVLYPKSNSYGNTTRSQIQSVHPCQVQIELWMLSSWFCYHIKLPDSQLPSKALTYFNATNISMVKDRT